MALVTLLATQAVMAHAIVYVAELKGSSVVPPTSSTATGVAFVLIDPVANTIGYAVVTTGFAGLNAATSANIHLGSSSANGDPQYPLDVDQTGNGSGSLQASAAEIAEWFRTEHYVSLRTAEFPNGAIRGQLELNPKGRLLQADLSGAKENPPTSSPATGFAIVYIDGSGDNLAYVVRATGFGDAPNAVTAGHIHSGGATANGNVRVPFVVDASGVGQGYVALTAEQKAILATNELYANLHTGAFPGGAIRGPLEADPGPSLHYDFARNETSGNRAVFTSLGPGPSVISAEARASGELIDIVEVAISQGPPQITVSPLFDSGEFAGGPLRVNVLTRPVTIATDTTFSANPGVITLSSARSGGISQPDFRNLFFQDYLVCVDDLCVNELAAIPTLFGPVTVGGPQIGAPPATPSLSVTAYNLTFEIITPGEALVTVHWRTSRTLRGVRQGDQDLPAADIVIAIPVRVTGTRPLPPYGGGEFLPGNLLEAQDRLNEMVQRAIDDFAVVEELDLAKARRK
jgi:hypothetical protein